MSFDDIDSLETDEEDLPENTYLAFNVSEEEYALEVRHVTEIVRLQKAFAVPDVPPFIRGVINLRGKVIPLLDVRARFGLGESQYNDRTVIVVIEHDDTRIGLVVDAVSDVSEIPPESIEPCPKRAHQTSSLVRGVSKRGERVNLILDVASLLAFDAPCVNAVAQAPNLLSS
jgi:purine-binding chemotaxis protein CheW